MASREQIQQEIQTLPQEALDLVAQFIQLLKKSSPAPAESPPITESSPTSDTTDWSDLIGCISVEENLSTTYKQVLAEEWGKKYDHR